MESRLEVLRGYVWGGGLIFLLLTTGVVYTIRLGLPQFRLIRIIRNNGRSHNSGISQVKTVCMSLGAAMGTGNIAGAAAAVAIGGAGALFWLWVAAFLGMTLVYAENSLSVAYSDENVKGPMAYISKGVGSKVLAAFFAISCALASVGMGGMVQTRTFADSLESCVSVNRYFLAAVLFIIIFLIISGGARRIGTAAQLLLPVASMLYALAAIAVIWICRDELPKTISNIFAEALGFKQAAGGSVGFALSVGIRRGVFSNEAGLGSSPVLHSAAESDSPEKQGAYSMLEVLIDTICCTLTAVMVLCASGEATPINALSAAFGDKAPVFLAGENAVFAFCTVIGWYYCGETAFLYLSGGRWKRGFCIFFALAAASGAAAELNTVWTLSDIFNGLMALPNLTGLIILIKEVNKPLPAVNNPFIKK